MALLRGTGHVQQPGVVARQLSPAAPRAKETLIGQVASCEGRCGRLEPDDGELSSPVLRGREVSNGLLLPDPIGGHRMAEARTIPLGVGISCAVGGDTWYLVERGPGDLVLEGR